MHSSRAMIYAVVIGLFGVGCKSKKSEPAPPPPGAGSVAGSAAPGAGSGSASGSAPGSAAEALPPVAAVDEAAVRKVVDAWLAAQNTGDFAAYQAIYADKMEGVKRVGVRTWRFDRKGWLADRERMFKHPMTVGARDLTIRGSATAPSVALVQSFAQGKFADEGPKHLVLTKGPSGFQIAREEMLASVVAGGEPAPGPGSLHLVIEVDGRPQVVIQGDADPTWGKGRIAGPFAGMHQFATQDVAGAAAAANWTGRALAVYGADGKRCDATVGALRLLGGGSPHFGEMQIWDGDPAMSDDGRVWSKAERARAIFDMSTPYLVGELAITGGCKALFATDPSATPTVFVASTGDDAVEASAVAAFRALPGWKELQRDFVDNYQGTGPWVAAPTVETFGNYVVVSASEGEGCGGFLGQLIAVFEHRAGKLVLVSDPADGYLTIEAVIDSDGDGVIELIGAVADFRMVTAHLKPTGTHFAPVAEVTFPFNDCGC